MQSGAISAGPQNTSEDYLRLDRWFYGLNVKIRIVRVVLVGLGGSWNG